METSNSTGALTNNMNKVKCKMVQNNNLACDETPEIQYWLLESDSNEEFLGAAAYCNGEELCRIKDISADRTALSQFLEECNRENVSLCHFHDVVEDFVAKSYETYLIV